MMRKKTIILFLGASMAATICFGGCGNDPVDVISEDQILSENKNNLQEEENMKSETVSVSMTIEEAQRNKKLITDSTENGIHFFYNNVLYGVPKWAQITDDLTGGNGIACLNNSPIVQMVGRQNEVLLLTEEGRVVSTNYMSSYFQFETEGEEDNIQLGEVKCLCGTGALLKDGRYLLKSDYSLGDVQETFMGEDVVEIQNAGYDEVKVSYAVALLKEDGTVEFLISSPTSAEDGQRVLEWNGMDVSEWTDIKCIDIEYFDEADNWMVGLKADGSLVATGEGYPEDILEWNEIVDVQIVTQYPALDSRLDNGDDEECGIVGLKKDGTLVCSENLESIGEDIKEWKNIKMMYCGGDCVAAVSEDGYFYRREEGSHIGFNFDIVYEYVDGEYIEKHVEKIVEGENIISLDY